MKPGDILTPLRQISGETRSILGLALLPRKKSVYRLARAEDTGLKRSYYITSEKGLYQAGPGGFFHLLDIPLYGMAFYGERVFMGLQIGKAAVLVAGRRQALEESGTPFGFRVLQSHPIATSNHRIHQVTAGRSGIWVANTSRNTLLLIDPKTEKVAAEIPVFFDMFGEPILHDHNHINSVMDYGSLVLFTACRAGGRSMIGVYESGKITGYFYEHPGGHDMYLTPDGFLFCDTFGSGGENTGGFPVTQDGFFAESVFRTPPGFVVRGAAGSREEFLIGHSHKGSRARRFAGQGALLVFDGENLRRKIETPCSQIYQIIGQDGSMLRPGREAVPEKVHALLQKRFGPPGYEREVKPL